MPNLYLANCTKQHFNFNFRNKDEIVGGERFDPHRPANVNTLPIRSGEQILLIKDGSRQDTPENRDFVVKQLKDIGAKELSDIQYDSSFSGFIFSFNKSIKESIIEEAHEKVVDKSINVSQKEIAKSTLATDNLIAKDKGGKRAKVSGISIEEIVPRHSEKKAFGFKMDVAEDGKDKLKL